MGFLRRLLGGNAPTDDAPAEDAPVDEPAADRPASPAEEPAARRAASPADAEDEAARDRELLREEAERLDDDLIQRQLRYADRAWIPPAQGGDRRSDDDQDGTPGS